MKVSRHFKLASVIALLAVPIAATSPVLAQKATGAATAERGTAMQVPLSKVSNPVGRLADSSVQDKNGDSVGSVRKVLANSAGKVTGVEVDVGGFLGVETKVVEIKARDLRYEQDRNVLTTTLRKSQIKALPEIKT